MSDEQYWRTPDAPGSGGPRNRQGSVGAGHQVTIAEQAERFDVGNAAFYHGGGESLERKQELGRTESGGGDLQAQTEQLWQTPATDSFRSRGGDRREEMGLDQQARVAFPSPAARDYRSPNLTPYGKRGGQMKGEQLQNYVEHLFTLPDQEILTPGANSSPHTPSLSRPDLNSIGSAMDSETLVYFQWAQRAWLRQGRIEPLPSSETESEESDSEDSLEPPSRENARERKQRKLWAYRQRTMGWNNPLKWTRPAFRRKLNEQFVESLMTWPPNWTSARTGLGAEVMVSWRSRARLQLSRCGGE